MPEIRSEVMTVNMGPQHPSTHGVLRLVLELDGETILSASPTIGYLHTGIEKTCEQKKWQQVIPLVERMDYLSAQSNSMAFCMSVEKLLGVEIPERVRNIPNRNVLTMAVGSFDHVLVRTHTERLEHGDRVLLCSDGLYNPVDDSTISQILEDSASLQQAVEALLDCANQNGGPDNVTAILLHHTDEGNG